MHGWGGACIVGENVCMAGCLCDGGVCMVGVCVCGRSMNGEWGHAW